MSTTNVNVDNVIERIKQLSDAKSNREVADLLGIAPSALSAASSRGSIPYKSIVQYAATKGVSIDWLLFGEGQGGQAQHIGDHKSEHPNMHGVAEAYAGYEPVRKYSVLASAGHGVENSHEQVDDLLMFQKAWIKKRGLDVGQLVAISARGDSMEPDIHDGDTLLIDRTHDRIHGGSIYVINTGNELLVKRVQANLDGSYSLISSNSKYQPQLLDPNSSPEIVGRVCWIGKDL